MLFLMGYKPAKLIHTPTQVEPLSKPDRNTGTLKLKYAQFTMQAVQVNYVSSTTGEAATHFISIAPIHSTQVTPFLSLDRNVAVSRSG